MAVILTSSIAVFYSNPSQAGCAQLFGEKKTSNYGAFLTAVKEARAKKTSFQVRVVRGEVERRVRDVVILGEMHLKMGKASRLGKEVVKAAPLIGVEGIAAKTETVWGEKLLGLLLKHRTLIRWASLGLIKDSTIRDARELAPERTHALEKTFVPDESYRAAVIYLNFVFGVSGANLGMEIGRYFGEGNAAFDFSYATISNLLSLSGLHLLGTIPLVMAVNKQKKVKPWMWKAAPLLGILNNRNMGMAEGTIEMLKSKPDDELAVTVMGMAHLPGYIQRLVEEYGFREIPFEEFESDHQ